MTLKHLTGTSKPFKSLFLAVALLLPLAGVQAQEAKVGFINTERVFREAAPAKAAQAKIEQEFSRREKELQDMAARLKSLSEKLHQASA